MRRRKWWWMVCLTLVMWVGSMGTVQAEVTTRTIDGETTEVVKTSGGTLTDFKMILPAFRYNSIEHWRLGAFAVGINYVGPRFSMYYGTADYSFYDQSWHGSLLVTTVKDHLTLYAKVKDNLSYRGIFQNEIFWQDEREFRAGLMHELTFEKAYLKSHLIGRYLQMEPRTEPGGYQFDAGDQLTLYTGLHGAYRGIEGKVEVEYGVPTEMTDFDHLRTRIALLKGFSLTRKDRIKLAGEVGILRGNYALQKQFFLGGSQIGLFPNGSKHFESVLNNGMEYPYTPTLYLPRLHLMGYREGAFHGDNMYIASIEYQRKLLEELQDENVALFRTFVLLGDTWEGDWKPTARPKVSIGFGFGGEPRLINHTEEPVSVSLTFAYGLGDEAALTIAIETGMSLEFTDLFNWQREPEVN